MTAREVWRGSHLAVRERGGWEHVVRVRASGVVAIVALTDAGELVLVEQHRPPLDGPVVELPAGLVGDVAAEEELLEAARRELAEETGFSARDWELVLDGPSSAGLADEVVHLWLARGLVREHAGGGDESEDITVHLVPVGRAQDWLRAARARGVHVDFKVLVGLWLCGTPWDGAPIAAEGGSTGR